MGQGEANPNANHNPNLNPDPNPNPIPNPHPNPHQVDPFETSRVWFQTRAVATHTGELMGSAPTGKRLGPNPNPHPDPNPN